MSVLKQSDLYWDLSKLTTEEWDNLKKIILEDVEKERKFKMEWKERQKDVARWDDEGGMDYSGAFESDVEE